MHAHKTHAYEMHAYETHACEMHTYEVHAHEVYLHEMHTRNPGTGRVASIDSAVRIEQKRPKRSRKPSTLYTDS